MFNGKQLLLFYRERTVFIFFNAAIFFLCVSVIWILAVIQPRTESIALHYDIFFGIDRIGSWFELLYTAGAICACILVNAYIAYYIFAKDKYLSYYLLLLGSIASFIFLLYLMSLTLFALPI